MDQSRRMGYGAPSPHAGRDDFFDAGETDIRALSEIETLIGREFAYDETRKPVLDQMEGSRSVGSYVIEPDHPRLVVRSETALPTPLLEQYERLECKSFVGLLPEISRAFVTIDNKLFLWNYHDGSDLCDYSKLGQIIVSIGLVKPKPNVFSPRVKYVLVITTPVEIVLLGCVFEGDTDLGELTLYETQFVLPTDNVLMLKVAGTSLGRIFLSGNDGAIYELEYQARDGWLSKKCRKINRTATRLQSILPTFLLGGPDDPIVDMVLDESRSPALLLALSQRNARRTVITAYHLGSDGKGFHYLARHEKIADEIKTLLAPDHVPSDLRADAFNIVSLCAIPRHEADRVIAAAVTTRGHRVLFELVTSRTIPGSSFLKVKAIRLSPPTLAVPPSAAAMSMSQRGGLSAFRVDPRPSEDTVNGVRSVRRALVAGGVTLMADARGEQGGADTLVGLLSSQAPSGHPRELEESVDAKALYRRISDMAEVPRKLYLTFLARCLYVRGQTQPLVGLSELAVQHALGPRQFLCLTSSGLTLLAKQRPVDELTRALQVRLATNDEGPVRALAERIERKEFCAMCLILATGSGAATRDELSVSGSLSPSTSRRRGAEDASFSAASPNRFQLDIASPDEAVAREAIRTFFQYGAAPVMDRASGLSSDYIGAMGGHSMYSSYSSPSGCKLDSLLLYVSRLLRPVWDWSVAIPKGSPQLLRFTKDHLSLILKPIQQLQLFLRNNWMHIQTVPAVAAGPSAAAATYSAMEADAINRELRQLNALRAFIDLSVEALTLLTYMPPGEQFLSIVQKLSSNDKQRLASAVFRDLLPLGPRGGMGSLSVTATAAASASSSSSSSAGSVGSDSDNLGRGLVAALVALYAQQTDTVNDIRRDCPTFFGQSDLLIYQAGQWVAQAAHFESDPVRRDESLSEALRIYKDSARNRKFPLEDACRRLREVHYYAGAIDLSLHRALLLTQNEIPPSRVMAAGVAHGPDIEHHWLNLEKKRCVESLRETLDIVWRDVYKNANEEPISKLTDAERREHQQRTLSVFLTSDRFEFKVELYQWLLDRSLLEELYAISSDSVIRFLRSDPRCVLYLKEYYLRKEMREEAVELLLNLAYSPSLDFKLADRLDFLRKAVTCAETHLRRCGPYGLSDAHGLAADGAAMRKITGDSVERMRDSLAVAEIQEKVLRAMSESSQDGKTQAHIRELDSTLLDPSKLYAMSESCRLFECCLELLALSDDPALSSVVNAHWINLIRSSIQPDMDWTIQFRPKLLQLADRFKDKPFVFPLDLVVRQLETHNYEYRPEPTDDFVVPALLECQLPIERLLEAYDRLLDDLPADLTQQVFRSIYRLLKVTHELYHADRFRVGSGVIELADGLMNRVNVELRASPDASLQQLFDEFAR